MEQVVVLKGEQRAQTQGMEIITKSGGIEMTYDNKLLATTAKVITTYLMVFGIMSILHWLDAERNILTLLGFWTVMVWCWKLLNYGDNLPEGNKDE
jgi:hypothetical protein